jgi:regulator of sirC expression with transglutaminase-like and TPR domain
VPIVAERPPVPGAEDATERFANAVALDDADVPIDEVAMLIAAHAHPGLDVDNELLRLDEIAGRCLDARSPAALTHRLFGELGFAGNVANYQDPRNSYLDEVVTRRLGIPITLSVLAMEVGRRIGVRLVGVGMPGHFLVRAGDEPDEYFDVFDGGRPLDGSGCRALFELQHGGAVSFSPSFLSPTPARAIVARMLANLENAFVSLGAPDAAWAARLHLLVPGLDLGSRRRAASVLASVGRTTEAAAALEDTAEAARDDDAAAADALSAEARALRARSN